MKETNAIKKMENLGTFNIENEMGTNKVLIVKGEKAELKVQTQHREAIIFVVRRLNDQYDMNTDYHAGSHYKNMKSAIAGFEELEG